MLLGRACTRGLFCLHLEQGDASAHAISQTARVPREPQESWGVCEGRSSRGGCGCVSRSLEGDHGERDSPLPGVLCRQRTSWSCPGRDWVRLPLVIGGDKVESLVDSSSHAGRTPPRVGGKLGQREAEGDPGEATAPWGRSQWQLLEPHNPSSW